MPSELPPRLEIGNPSLNQLPVWQTLDNMTGSRADTVSTCCNGPSLWRPRAVRQSLPAFQIRVWICVWAQALSRRGLWTRVLSSNDMARSYMIAIIAQLTMPGLWVGSDRLAEFAKSN